MRTHWFWMMLGCTLPLLLVFAVPLLGVSGNVGTFLFVLMMFACHLMMMRGHGHGHGRVDDTGEERHGRH